VTGCRADYDRWRDGSARGAGGRYRCLPTSRSASFVGGAEFEIPATVDQVIARCSSQRHWDCELPGVSVGDAAMIFGRASMRRFRADHEALQQIRELANELAEKG